MPTEPLLQRVIATVVPYTRLLARLRGPLVVALAAFLLLGFPDQIQELVTAAALDLRSMVVLLLLC